MTTQRPRLLVTGAGGQLGRRVVELLLDAGADVIATTRDPSKLADLAARGAEVRHADFDDPTSLDVAFAGVDRLLLISTDALDAPGRRIAQHHAAIAAAQRAGVKHLAYTSAPSPRPQAGGGVIDDHFWTEQAIAATDLDWTFLRHALYADLVLMSGPQAVASGQLFSATAGRGRAYITHDELAALLSDLSGKSVTHVSLDAAALKAGLLAAGLPPVMAEVLVTFDVEAAQGYHAVVTDAVERLGGKTPTSLRDFLAANSEALG